MASSISPSQAPFLTGQSWTMESEQEPLQAARMAFEDGVKAFQEMTNDPKKKMLAVDLLTSYTMQDVLDSVREAKSHYQRDRVQSKTRQYLIAFSHRVVHYGSVLDVLVQHHPEYTSLAWGAMKIVFGAVIEHERTGTTIVAALCDISESLPTAESALTLYPTPVMIKSVSMLYAHIMRFLVRAWKFYHESKLMHLVHSVTRPAALRYDDLLQSIKRDAESVRRLTVTNSQEEVRSVHNEVRDLREKLETVLAGRQIDSDGWGCLQGKMDVLTEMLTDFRQSQAWANAAQAKSQLEMHASMSDFHTSQALLTLQSQCSVDHKLVLQTASAEQSYYRHRPGTSGKLFWNSPKLRTWDRSNSSCTILLKSTHRERIQTRGFCVDVVEQILKTPTPLKQSAPQRFKPSSRIVFWVLGDRGRTYSLIETLKSLVYQALCFRFTASTISPSEISFHVNKFRDAYFEDDYLEILGSLLHDFKLICTFQPPFISPFLITGFPRPLPGELEIQAQIIDKSDIVANAEAFAPDTAAHCRDSLRRLSRMLSERKSETVLKILTTAYGPLERKKDGDAPQDLVLDVGRGRGRRTPRQGLGRSRTRT